MPRAAKHRVFMSARQWNLLERVMYSSPRLFTNEAEAQADVDHYNKGTMGNPFIVVPLDIEP